jgi:hypothetical protein
MEYSSQLEAKSAELTQTAARLREVNQKLTELSVQKDGFLSQISHELRTHDVDPVILGNPDAGRSGR